MIAAFYGGKSILITGATGFMGKVLMEKLFRTSPDLKVVYILVRPKQGQTLQQRVFQILDSKVCLMGRVLGGGDSLQCSLIAPAADGTQNIWVDRGEETKQESNQQVMEIYGRMQETSFISGRCLTGKRTLKSFFTSLWKSHCALSLICCVLKPALDWIRICWWDKGENEVKFEIPHGKGALMENIL